MSDLLPCPFCNCLHAPGVLTINVGHSGGYHHVVCNTNYAGCGAQGAVASTPEHAVAAWNRRAPTDPALLALAKLAAKLFDRAWIRSVGFVNEGGIQDDLDRDTVAFGLVRYEAPGDFQMAPGIADAIAALLAPDGAGEAAP